MSKLAKILIIVGILCFAGIIFISAESEVIPDNIKTIGFIVLGYIGVISFSYGWLNKFKKINEDKK